MQADDLPFRELPAWHVRLVAWVVGLVAFAGAMAALIEVAFHFKAV